MSYLDYLIIDLILFTRSIYTSLSLSLATVAASHEFEMIIKNKFTTTQLAKPLTVYFVLQLMFLKTILTFVILVFPITSVNASIFLFFQICNSTLFIFLNVYYLFHRNSGVSDFEIKLKILSDGFFMRNRRFSRHHSE